MSTRLERDDKRYVRPKKPCPRVHVCRHVATDKATPPLPQTYCAAAAVHARPCDGSQPLRDRSRCAVFASLLRELSMRCISSIPQVLYTAIHPTFPFADSSIYPYLPGMTDPVLNRCSERTDKALGRLSRRAVSQGCASKLQSILETTRHPHSTRRVTA